MISLRSIINFFITNIFIVSLGLLEYYVMLLNMNIINYIIVFLFTLFRNYCLIYAIDHVLTNKPHINEDFVEPIEQYYGEFQVNVIVTAFIESITVSVIKQYVPLTTNIVRDILTLLPLSFMFEVIFDFFHYWTHRMCHANKYLYAHSHKKHHTHKHVTSILTFYQHPIDIIISNVIPLVCTLYILRRITLFQLAIIVIYKTFTEISGHHGKQTHPNACFPQCIWLPKFLQIELYAEDHNFHHTLNNCNYAKRFSLWDKLFGTHHA